MLLLLASDLHAQQYIPADSQSAIRFTIKNFGINTSGIFSGINGTIHFDANDISNAAFNVRLNAASVDTDNNTRDNHLKKEEYFNVKQYPYISFSSTAVKKMSDGRYLLQGNITIKGVTKPVAIPFSVMPQNDDLLFTGDFQLNRRDFKVGGKSIVLSDNLTITLSVLAKKIDL